MKTSRANTLVTTMVVALGLAAAVVCQAIPRPQATGRGRGADSGGPPVILDATKSHDVNFTLDIVEVVGCLAEGPNKTYVLTDATDPVKSDQASTTKTAIEAAKVKPLGTQRYVIIGASEWDPASHKGHKMAVKGLMIKDAKETRLNVTSFQMVDSTCAKAKP
jgi:hypothetical protein